MREVSAFVAMAALMVALAGHAYGQNPPGLDFGDVGIYACDYDFLDFANLKFTPGRPAEDYAGRVNACAEREQFLMLGLYTWDRVTHKKPLEEVFADTDKILDAVDLSKVGLIFLDEEEVDWQGGFDYLNAIYDHVKSKYEGPIYQWYSMPMGPRCDQKADGWILDAYGMDYETFRKHLMRFIVIDKPVIACINATPGVNSLLCSKEQVRVCEEFNIPVFYYCVDGPLGSPNMYLSTDRPDLTKWRSWFYQVLRKSHTTDTSRLPAETAQHSSAEDFEVAGDGSGQFTFTDDFSNDSFLTRASIRGFLSLAWSSLTESLWLKDGDESAELVYHLSTPFGFAAPVAEVRGTGKVSVALSSDGREWTEDGQSAGLAEMKGRNLWVKLTLEPSGEGERTELDALTVSGEFAAPEDAAYHLVKDFDSQDRPTHGSRTEITYADKFDSQRYLHIGQIEGDQDLEWRPGMLGTHGVEGRAARVLIKQHFKSEKPLNVTRVALDCVSYANFGAHNEIFISTDGETPLASATTQGKEREKDRRFYGVLELDLAGVGELGSVTDFWVHMLMVNGCGKKSNTTNQLRELTIEAKLAE